MLTINHKYTPSVNILRDKGNELQYLPTKNALLILEQLINSYSNGARHSFTIIGSYGTGKSAFLWALENTLSKTKTFFPALASKLDSLPEFEFISFVGEYTSLLETFGNTFDLKGKQLTKPQLIQKIEERYQQSAKNGKGLAIIIDEFGKFLEYAFHNKPENELYFIQQLAEIANDPNKNLLFITTLHQGFDAYSLGLDKSPKQEWDKVRGRVKELTFNEPVEQLLNLASSYLMKLKTTTSFSFYQPDEISLENLFTTITEAKVFPLKDSLNRKIAHSIFPLDILSASILALALQRYGQNERSLFSFLEGNEYLGWQDVAVSAQKFYSVNEVYDYLAYNYYNLLISKDNPHYPQWLAIRTGLERAEGVLETEENLQIAQKLLKTIGLLNLFVPESARLDNTFLKIYGKYALDIKSEEKVEEVLNELERKKIIIYRKFKQKYNLFEGTDLDIQLAIDDAGKLVQEVSNVVAKLNENYISLPYVLAKSYFFETGTPRFFAFRLTDTFIDERPEGELDGFISLLFSEKLSEKDVQKKSLETQEAIIYGLYLNTKDIKNYLLEIEKVKKVIEENEEDKVAVRELSQIINHYTSLIHQALLGKLFGEKTSVVWYFKGEKYSFLTAKTFNQFLSKVCKEVYNKTPTFHFEMVNKTRLSSAMLTAKGKLLEAITNKYNVPNLGFEVDKFPPEKSIYLSLIQKTGMHSKGIGTNIYGLQAPTEVTILELWKSGEAFLESTKLAPRKISELVEKWQVRPFKLKKGFLDFWLPIFLFANREDFALYGSENDFIPVINNDILDLIGKEPHRFELKAFDLDGVKVELFNRYREFLQQSETERPDNSSLIETIKPFLTFYRQLPEYTKKTKRLTKSALQIREVIANAKDPEKTFFEDLPKALGYKLKELTEKNELLQVYIPTLQSAIRDLRSVFEHLLTRLEDYLKDRIGAKNKGFPDYREVLKNRYKKLKTHLLLPHQKVFWQRVGSQIQDRNAWLMAIADSIIGKSLENIIDVEEAILYDKLNTIIYELDNLNELSVKDVDLDNETLFKVELTDFVEGFRKQIIRLPKQQDDKLKAKIEGIKALLEDNKNENIAILVQLLQDELLN
jgi:hypothetical protein